VVVGAVALAVVAATVPLAVAQAGSRTAGTTPAGAAAAPAAVAAAPVKASTVAAAPAARAAACRLGWNAAPEVHASRRVAPVVAVRSGRHDCFDRFVVETSGRVDGYSVRYVRAIVQDGSGHRIPVAGGAKLEVVVVAPAYTGSGRATYVPADPRRVVGVAGYRTFRQAVYAGSFEGRTTFGLGVRARLPFRAAVLAGPRGHSRLVVDVAHRW
jgi:hypothetical protein